MLVIRAGAWSQWLNLGHAVAESSDQSALTVDPGIMEGVKGVRVRLRTVSRAVYLESMTMFRAALDKEGGYLLAATPAMRLMVQAGVAQVDGLKAEDDTAIHIKATDAENLAEDALSILEDARLLEPLFLVSRVYNELGAEGKKAFGQSVPLISQSSIAAPALKDSKGSEGATEAA